MKETYSVGEIINPLLDTLPPVQLHTRKAHVRVPARVDTFLCHHQYFVKPPRLQVYPVNSINFGIEQITEAQVQIRDDLEIVIAEDLKRPQLLKHAALIMLQTLNVRYGLTIKAQNLHSIQHGGLGSSAALITATAQAINKLFGEPLSQSQMTKLLAQNYGEETEQQGILSSMASIGGATATGLSSDNLIIIGGEAEIWFQGMLPSTYEAVFLYPKYIQNITGQVDMELYEKGFSMFREMGVQWGGIKESILREKIIPGLESGDFSSLFRHINMYTLGAYGDIPLYFKNRWSSHGIFFDSLIHQIFSRLFDSLHVDEHCFFVSSGGPLIVVITHSADEVCEKLTSLDSFHISRVSLSQTSGR